ncbi:MAG: hypothetical protein HRT35_08620 [Algicola sp.]|nr:hypothetical protein [Algicola sp.]
MAFRRTVWKSHKINFDDVKLGEGLVIFQNAQFADGDIYFSRTGFGDGNVNFEQVKFGKGSIDFTEATFGHGDISFDLAEFNTGETFFNVLTFGSGNVSFANATFGAGIKSFGAMQLIKGNVDFQEVKFGDGDVDFKDAQFGKDSVSFKRAIFGEGSVNFIGASFGDGQNNFSKIDFGKGHVNFAGAKFNAGNLKFYKSTFEQGDANFAKAEFGSGQYDFKYVRFNGNVSLDGVKNSQAIESLSFKHAMFESSLDLTNLKLNCVLDLTNTKLANQVALDGLACKPTRTGNPLRKEASDKDDAGRLRRLKEIAENNKDHELALRFHADEMRAKRWIEKGFFASLLDGAFSVLSNYGQSIGRPVAAFCLLFVIVVTLFTTGVPNTKAPLLDTVGHAIVFTAVNSIPVIANARKLKERSAKVLFGYKPTAWANVVMVTHSVLSIICLFLIGLGLRNRFRI